MSEIAFTPDINWEALDGGAHELHWLPESPTLGHFKKGILLARLLHTKPPGYCVQLVHRVRAKRRKRGELIYAPIYYRHTGMSVTVPLFDYQCEDRLLVLAHVQEAYKVATVPGYKRQYVRTEQFQTNLER